MNEKPSEHQLAELKRLSTEARVPDESEIIARLATRLAKFKLPKRIFTTRELPRNAMGKVQKGELRRLHAAIFTRA